ncbi:hypothetical protein STEG23_009012 [Scotinomys teguina]
MVTSSIAGWRLLLIRTGVFSFCCLALDSSSSFPCPAFQAIAKSGLRALSAHQDNMSESDSKEKGNLKEERPKSSKASTKLHTKVEKEKETDQGKTKQKPSGLYPVLDKFADINLSDSAEEDRRIGCASRLVWFDQPRPPDSSQTERHLNRLELEKESKGKEKEVLEGGECAPPVCYTTPSAPLPYGSGSSRHSFNPEVWKTVKTELQLACPVFQDLQGQRYHEPLDFKDQENPIWIPERLTCFIRHEDPDPDTSDKPDSSPDQSRDQSRTGDAVVGSDQNVADPDANLMRPEMKAE